LYISVPILGAMGIGDPDWAPWVLGEEKVLVKTENFEEAQS
jgi:hypothetical protein